MTPLGQQQRLGGQLADVQALNLQLPRNASRRLFESSSAAEREDSDGLLAISKMVDGRDLGVLCFCSARGALALAMAWAYFCV